MARLLLIHPSRSAIEREAGEALLAGLRHAELDAELCGATPGPAWLDQQLRTCEGVVLIEPNRWWPRSPQDHLDRPWLTTIGAHVEFDRRNGLGRVAGMFSRVKSTNPEHAALRWFRWQGDWDGLLDWAAASSPPTRAFDFALDTAIAGDHRRDDLLTAIDRALASKRRVVAIAGVMGSGKTRLVRDWLGRAAGRSWTVAHHFALAEHGATTRAALAGLSLARQLDPEASDLADGLVRCWRARPNAKVVLVVDGVERIDDRQALLALPTELVGRVRWLVSGRLWPAESETTTVLDLDAPTWASTAATSTALASEITRLDDADHQALVERAAGNLGYVAAVAEQARGRMNKVQLRGSTKPASPPVLPQRFAIELAGVLGRLVELPIAERRRAELILDVLAVAAEPLPAAILLACLDWSGPWLAAVEPVRELVRVDTSTGEPILALFQPTLAELRQFELDDRSELERLLLAGIERVGAVAEAEPSAAVHAYQAGHAPALRRKLSAALPDWLVEVDKLVAFLRTHGPAKLERVLEGHGEGLAADLLALVRAQHAVLVGTPALLPGLLWNGLLDRGWSVAELSERLRWPSGLPSVRRARPLEHVDRCFRSLPHPGDVHACAISSDGSRVLSACDDGRLRLWSRASGDLLASFDHGGLVRACAITPDGLWAVSGGTHEAIKRWDLGTLRAAGECTPAKSTLTSLAINREGTHVLAGDDEGKVLAWRPIEGVFEQLGSHGERISDVAISADGRLGLSGGGKRMTVWDLATHRKLGSPPDHEYSINNVVFGPDDRSAYTVAIGESRRVSLVSFEIEQRYGDLSGNLEGCSTFDSGKRLVVGEDQQLVVWDMVEAKQVAAIHAHASGVEDSAVTPDGRWVASAGGTQVEIWPAEAFASPASARWSKRLAFVSASPDGTRAIVCHGGYELSIVEVASGRVTGTLDVQGLTNAVAWIDDDRLLTVGATSHRIAIWSVSQRKSLAARELGSDWLRGCAISPDRRRALIAGDEKRTWLVDLDDLSRDRVLGSQSAWVRACKFSSDGERALAVDNDGKLTIWSVADRKCIHRLESPASYSTYTALVTIGDLAFVGGTRLDVWDIDDGKLIVSPTGHVGKILALGLAAEGRVLISAGEDATLRFWTVGRSPTEITALLGHAPFTSVSLAGSLLLASDAAGNLWELIVDWPVLAQQTQRGRHRDGE